MMKNIVLAAFATLALAACSSATGGAPAIARVGAQAPAFNEPLVGGGDLSMASLKGEPVYLNFFATWCPPCNEEAPDISAVAAEFKGDGLHVVGIDVLENAAKARQFVEAHHLIYPAVVDSGTLRDAYRIDGMPVHVFIARDGTIKKIFVGELSKAQMIADVKTIL
jgi:cytochrome c biogenesis protein CcmG/thiol:disulfide interchange protein DsbE